MSKFQPPIPASEMSASPPKLRPLVSRPLTGFVTGEFSGQKIPYMIKFSNGLPRQKITFHVNVRPNVLRLSGSLLKHALLCPAKQRTAG